MQLRKIFKQTTLPRILVNRDGEVYSELSGGIIKGRPCGPEGKEYMAISYGGKNIKIHRIVAQTFIPNPLNKPCVNHKDGNKFNNKVENLEWATHSENSLHAVETGLNPKRGSINQNAKLNSSMVENIRVEVAQGRRQIEVANRFNIDQSVVSKIVNRKIWNHAAS